MKLQRLKIRNILGIEELDVELNGNVTIISGGNAAGKTSVLEAIKATIRGGHDATLLRQGAEEGETVLVVDETEVQKVVDASRSKLNVRHPEFGRISSPQTWLNGLVDAELLDPAAFMAAEGPERVRMIMEAWPVTITPEQLQDAVGDAYPLPTQLSENALEAVAQAHKLVYDERTGVNRVGKEKDATAAQLSAGLPEDEDDGAGHIGPLRQEHERGTRALDAKRESIRAALDTKRERIREEAAAKIRRIEKEKDDAVAAATKEAEAERTRVESEYGPALADLRSRIDRLEERARHAAAHAQTRRTVQQMRAEAEAARKQSQALTRALANLDALKLELARQIPIEGVEIRDNEVHIGGIPFPRLNRAKQITTAVSLTAERAGDLGIVCVDGLEALDPETLPEFLAALEESGLHAFVTRVTSGPLQIGGAP